MTNGAQWRSCLMSDHWFGELPAFLQDSLMTGMVQRRFTPGRAVFRRGEPACGLYALMSGEVRFDAPAQQRQGVLRSDAPSPYWFGEVSLFDGKSRLHDVFAENPVILLHAPQRTLDQLLQQRPEYWRYFADLLGRKLGLKAPHPQEVTLLPTEERLAFRLLLLTHGYGQINRSLHLVSLGDIRSDQRLGLAPEVVDRVLGTFAERGIIRREQDVICVLDTDRLRDAARHRLTR